MLNFVKTLKQWSRGRQTPFKEERGSGGPTERYEMAVHSSP